MSSVSNRVAKLNLLLAAGALLHAGFFATLAYGLNSSLVTNPAWLAFVAIVLVGSTMEACMTLNAQLPAAEMFQCGTEHRVAQVVGVIIGCGFVLSHMERAWEVGAEMNVKLLGLALLAVGFGLRLWSIASIGSDFQTTLAVPKVVVTTGPYRLTRHPAEIGMVLLAVGGPLAIGAIQTAMLVLVSLAPFVYWRIGQENRMLS